MSMKSKFAVIATLATIIAAPANAAQVTRHTPRAPSTGIYVPSPYNPWQGRDWQLDGRLPLAGPYWAQ